METWPVGQVAGCLYDGLIRSGATYIGIVVRLRQYIFMAFRFTPLPYWLLNLPKWFVSERLSAPRTRLLPNFCVNLISKEMLFVFGLSLYKRWVHYNSSWYRLISKEAEDVYMDAACGRCPLAQVLRNSLPVHPPPSATKRRYHNKCHIHSESWGAVQVRVIVTQYEVTIICQTTWRMILLYPLDATH